LQTYWENVAATAWGNYVSGVERRIILHAQSLAGNPTKALEIGCEGGRWAKLLADMGWRLTCIDVDTSMLNECRRKVPNAECILADRKDVAIPCDSGSMSLVLCVEVAPVIQSDWFLSEAARVLRIEGIFVGTVWNKVSLRGLTARIRHNGERRNGPRFYKHSYRAWKRQLCNAGFEVVHEEGLCWAPFGRTSNSSLIPFATNLERLLRLHHVPTISPWIAFIARKVKAKL
jgi:SAM-dependent methyltransferase